MRAEKEAELARLQARAAEREKNIVDPRMEKEKELARLQRKAIVNIPAAKPEVLQEMHPDFTAADRLVVKNFSNSPEAAARYLQKRHPNLEVSTDEKGQYLARGKGSNDPYRVLDPDTGLFSSDILRDAGDVIYDTGAGALQSAATAGAALAAAVPTAGVGSLPAGIAAGAGTGAVFEGLRQGLGRLLGVNEEFDGTDIGIAAATGGAGPLMFGTGAAAPALTKKILAKGIDISAKEGGEQLSKLGLSQRGALSRAYDATPLAWAGSALSGASSDALRTLSGKWDQFTDIAETPGGVRNFLHETGGMVKDGFSKAKSAAADLYSGGVDAATSLGKSIDVSPTVQQFQRAIAAAEEGAKVGTDGSKELLSTLRESYNKHFLKDAVELVPVTKKIPGPVDQFGKPTFETITEMVEKPTRVPISKLSPREAVSFGKELSGLADLGSLKPGTTGVMSNRMQGATPAEQSLMHLAGGLKKDVDGLVEPVIGEGAMDARRQLGKLTNLEREVRPSLENPQTMFATLRNLDLAPNMPRDALLKEVDSSIGSNLIERAKMAQTLETFGPGRQSWFSSLKNPRRIPAAAALGTGGYLAGRQTDGGQGMGGAGGAAAGVTLGATLASPQAMKQYIKGAVKAGKLNELLKNIDINGYGLGGANVGIQSAWNSLEDKK